MIYGRRYASLLRLTDASTPSKGLLLVLAALVVHTALLESPIIIGEPYFVAQHLAEGAGYSSVYPFAPADQVHNYVPPGYTLLLWLVIEAGIGIWGTQVLQLVFLALALLVLHRISAQQLGHRAALVGLLLLSFYLPLWRLAACIDPNALNLLLIALTLKYALKAHADFSSRNVALLAFVIGIQLLIRPDVILLVPILGGWLVWKKKPTHLFKPVAMGSSIIVMLLLPWGLRNVIVFEQFMPISSNGGYNLFIGNNDRATGEWIANEQLSQQDQVEISAFSASHTQPELDLHLRERALAWIGANPGEAAKLALQKLTYHWWRSPGGVREEVNPLMQYYDMGLVFVYLLAGAGLIVRRRSALQQLTLIMCAYSSLVALIFFNQTRHRLLKVEPLLLLFAAVAIVELVYVVRAKRQAKISALLNT
jgi:hypothetical protein